MRWIRLNVSFDDSPWLFVLSAEAQLAWIKLLCYVKRDGVKGQAKVLQPLVAAKRWGVGEESVVKMLQAAAKDGAIISDGVTWTLANWAEYQEQDETARDRMRRWRDRQKEHDPVTDSYGVTPVTSVTNGVTCRVTETGTETGKKEKTPTGSKRKSPSLAECVAYFEAKGSTSEAAENFFDHYEAIGWLQGKAKAPIRKWENAASRWIRTSQGPGRQPEQKFVTVTGGATCKT